MTLRTGGELLIESLIQHYGYLALFVGTLFEGEAIVVLAGFAAHRGFLHLSWVMIVAFVGTVLADQSYFTLGRKKGRSFVESRPRWQARAARVQRLLARYEWGVVFGFRFLYGIRSVTPFVIGASGYPWRRFTFLNVIGAAVWSVVVALLGYSFGTLAEQLIADVRQYELLLLGLLAACALVIWAVHCYRIRRRAERPESHPETPPAPTASSSQTPSPSPEP